MMEEPPAYDGADHVNKATLLLFTRAIETPIGASAATTAPIETVDAAPKAPSEPTADTRKK